MRQASAFTSQRVAELDQIVLSKWTPEVFNRFQCVWLSFVLDMPAPEIATALGLNVSTVRRIRTEFLRDGSKAIVGKGNRGGRRNQHMSFEEEAEFLRDHPELFTRSGAGDVKSLKDAFEARIGKAVHKTTIYRLLERHGKQRMVSTAHKLGSGPAASAHRKRSTGGIPGGHVRKRKGRKAR
jgi:hypothetical protein